MEFNETTPGYLTEIVYWSKDLASELYGPFDTDEEATEYGMYHVTTFKEVSGFRVKRMHVLRLTPSPYVRHIMVDNKAEALCGAELRDGDEVTSSRVNNTCEKCMQKSITTYV